MNFKNVKLKDLQITHSEMCATAGDLGIKVPAHLTVDFDTEVAGVPICTELDTLIQERQKALASSEGKAQVDAPKSRDVKSGPETTKKMAAQRAARLAKEKAVGNTAPADVPKPSKKGSDKTGEEPVKKAVAKKAAKKKVAKKAVSGNGVAKRSKFEDEAKVTWVAKENPARKDTARWERYEKLRKGTGKTVKALLASGVPSATLANAVGSKTIKIG